MVDLQYQMGNLERFLLKKPCYNHDLELNS